MEVLEGKRYVHAHCYRADEILMLLRVADDFGFKIRTLQHVLEGYKVAGKWLRTAQELPLSAIGGHIRRKLSTPFLITLRCWCAKACWCR